MQAPPTVTSAGFQHVLLGPQPLQWPPSMGQQDVLESEMPQPSVAPILHTKPGAHFVTPGVQGVPPQAPHAAVPQASQ